MSKELRIKHEIEDCVLESVHTEGSAVNSTCKFVLIRQKNSITLYVSS